MRKYIILLVCILGMLGCTKKDENNFFIEITSFNKQGLERDSKDYIRCWINDSLIFNGLYKTYYDSAWDTYYGTEVANFDKRGRDSIKIKIRLITLDSLLFGNKKVVDTTFFYRMDSIPGISIVALRPFKHFDIYDPISCPAAFEIE
jgi:hypothetical protein